MNRVKLLLVLLIGLRPGLLLAQRSDSIPKLDTVPSFIKGRQPNPNVKPAKPTDSPYESDSVSRKRHDPRKATLYSTFLPGLGQFYNKKYWKLPLVGAALGIPAYLYFDNKKQYAHAQYALGLIIDHQPDTVPESLVETTDPILRDAVRHGDANDIRSYRNQVRQYQDYSVIFFFLFWGLQIVDATVDAHLKEFDVSDQLSLRIAPASPETGLYGKGVSLLVDIHPAKPHRPYSNP